MLSQAGTALLREKDSVLVEIGGIFNPHSDAKKLYYVYLLVPELILVVLISLICAVIITRVSPPTSWIATSILVIPYLAVSAFVAYWIPKYLSTVTYMLGEDRIVFERGIWWRTKSFVPYNRITNIDLVQGPISRRFGLGKVSIQTAGYSGQSSSAGRFAEITIFGVEDFEEIKDRIMDMTSRFKPVATEAGVETHHRFPDAEILEELRRIRKGIEDLSSRAQR